MSAIPKKEDIYPQKKVVEPPIKEVKAPSPKPEPKKTSPKKTTKKD